MTVISSSAPCAAIPLVRAGPEYLNPDPWHRVLTLHTHRILSRLPLILQHRLTDSENLQPVAKLFKPMDRGKLVTRFAEGDVETGRTSSMER